MADYYPLISRAVAGLDKNTGEQRRALYERARNALVDQLRGVTPALSESEITRERLALEEAIRKVETEEAKRIRQEASRMDERRLARGDIVQSEQPLSAPEEAQAPPLNSIPAATVPPALPSAAELSEAPPLSADALAETRRPARKRPPENAAPIRATPAEGGPTAGEEFADPALQAAEEARKAYLAAPAAPSERPQPDARGEADSRSDLARRGALSPATARGDMASGLESDLSIELAPTGPLGKRPLDRPQLPDSVRAAAARARRSLGDTEEYEPLSRRLLSGLVRIAIGVVLIAIVAATAYWQRHNLLTAVRNVASLGHGTNVPAPVDSTPQRTKIPDRIGQQDTAQRPGATTTPAPSGQVEAPVAQRVVLYEEDPGDSAGKQYVGTVVWRTETVSPGQGQPQDIAVRGDITIPERNMSVTWSLRRNTDKDLPASHTVSIMFTLPADFSHGGISEIRGVLMKQTEQTRGVSLAGLSVKVTTGFFLIGLSAADADVQRNIQLLKDRAWFDIAIVYTDGRRAILAVEKGTPGDRAFAEAFAGWGQ